MPDVADRGPGLSSGRWNIHPRHGRGRSPGDQVAKDLLLLIEPRATVHAYCGVLPVKEVRLAREEVDRALSALEVPLHVRVSPSMKRS